MATTLAATTTSSRICAVLLVLGLVTRFVLLTYPRQVVWDEYHFGKFVNGYITGDYFFDIHPPTGKLLLALSAWLGGYYGSQSWDKIGLDIAPEVNLYALRCLPALQGAVVPPLLFATARSIGLSRPASLVPAAAALFDICLLVESRLILTDATLIMGIVLQLLGACARTAFPSRLVLVARIRQVISTQHPGRQPFQARGPSCHPET